MTRNSFVLVLVCPFLIYAGSEGFQARTFKGSAPFTLPYRIFIPEHYDANKSYPVVLALHGSGERGDDNLSPLTANHLATVWTIDSNQSKFPCFVVVPQCPKDSTWVKYYSPIATTPISGPMKTVMELLDSLAVEFHFDPDRIYIVGLSMGGFAAWDAISRFPDRFAAAIPICGAGDTTRAESIKRIPIWAFHGSLDPKVPVSGSRDMISAIQNAGGEPNYFEYLEVGHDSWTPAFAERNLVSWLFAQKRNADNILRAQGESNHQAL
jgi:predicted peptidase